MQNNQEKLTNNESMKDEIMYSCYICLLNENRIEYQVTKCGYVQLKWQPEIVMQKNYQSK